MGRQTQNGDSPDTDPWDDNPMSTPLQEEQEDSGESLYSKTKYGIILGVIGGAAIFVWTLLGGFSKELDSPVHVFGLIGIECVLGAVFNGVEIVRTRNEHSKHDHRH